MTYQSTTAPLLAIRTVTYCTEIKWTPLSTQQAAKFVPIAGQAISAALTYSSLRYVCEQHIQQCVAVSKQLLLAASSSVDVGA